MSAEPWFTRQHGAYRCEWSDPERAIIEFELVRVDRGDVTAEVSVTSTAPAFAGLIHHARVNLVSTRSRQELAKHVAGRTNGLGVDWQQLVEIACLRTLQAFRAGAPAVLLRDVEEPVDAGDVLPPLLVARMPTALFGDGGSGKSLVALAAGASVHTGRPILGLEPATTHRVGYLDYEMDGWEHHKRLRGLLGDDLPDIVYIPCSRPLAEDVDRIRRYVRQHDLGYLVVDSVGLACDGPPEAAEVANRYFGALREIGLGSLSVAHVNRSGDTDRPFGSAFWHNGFRRTWYAKREQDLGAGRLTLGLFNKKSNTGPLSAPLGFAIEWGDAITIAKADIGDIPDLSRHVPLAFRIADELRGGAKTVAEIAADLEANAESVRTTLKRKSDLFVSVSGPDGIYRWGLLERTRQLSGSRPTPVHQTTRQDTGGLYPVSGGSREGETA